MKNKINKTHKLVGFIGGISIGVGLYQLFNANFYESVIGFFIGLSLIGSTYINQYNKSVETNSKNINSNPD